MGSSDNVKREVLKNYLVPLFAALIGSGITGFVDWRKADDNRLATLFDELERARLHEKEQDDTIYALQAEVTRLTIQLSKHYDDGKALKDYLRPMPIPGWIKITDIPVGTTKTPINPRIEMWYINPAYERMFAITDAKYRGKTDFEVGHWSDAVAASFRTNDMTMLNKMGGGCGDERFPTFDSNGRLRTGNFCKWVVEVNGFIAIAGHLRLLKETDR